MCFSLEAPRAAKLKQQIAANCEYFEGSTIFTPGRKVADKVRRCLCTVPNSRGHDIEFGYRLPSYLLLPLFSMNNCYQYQIT